MTIFGNFEHFFQCYVVVPKNAIWKYKMEW